MLVTTWNFHLAMWLQQRHDDWDFSFIESLKMFIVLICSICYNNLELFILPHDRSFVAVRWLWHSTDGNFKCVKPKKGMCSFFFFSGFGFHESCSIENTLVKYLNLWRISPSSLLCHFNFHILLGLLRFGWNLHFISKATLQSFSVNVFAFSSFKSFLLGTQSPHSGSVSFFR